MPANVNRLYFDHAATTPVRDEAIAAMLPHFATLGYNPSSPHAEGRAARAALDQARASVAALFGVKPREIVFTGGGSEANNLAILGAARARRRRDGAAHVVTAATEHHAVLHATDVLRAEGFEIATLAVDEAGRLPAGAVEAALRPDTALVTLMLANNELGTVHALGHVARAARACGAALHVDAVQAAGRLALDAVLRDVDLLSISAHKFYGPKGVGALYVRAGTELEPLIVGGGQEAGRRAGTENVAGIAGLACALELALAERPAEAARLSRLRDRLEAGLLAAIPDIRINAVEAPRLPNLSSVAFAGIAATTLLVRLDLAGIAVSAGSACAAGSTEPSHVIAATGAPDWVLGGTIRFSLGKLTNEAGVERLLATLPGIVGSLRGPGRNMGTSFSGSFESGRTEVFS